MKAAEKFRFHVVGLPHTQTTSDYLHCAYTQKTIKFCKMMKSLGHQVYLYASEDNDAPCDELITIAKKAEQAKWFDNYDFKHQLPNKLIWDPSLEYWKTTNQRAARAIKQRAKPRDFICVLGGNCQQQIAELVPQLMTVEYGIGYTGPFSAYKVFESYAHMHWLYGRNNIEDGQILDTVIPNYFDPKDFPFKRKKDDFLLYAGRLVKRKGVEMAVEAAKRTGNKLVMIGQGVIGQKGNQIISNELPLESGEVLKLGPPGSESSYHSSGFVLHLGPADRFMRGQLMSRAKGVFLTSEYLEPFGGTSIEPMFCGTPVITTDWGAFPENIVDQKVGYRVRTLGEAIWAVENLNKLKPDAIRRYALNNFALDRVRWQYQAYFEQLSDLHQNNTRESKWNRGVSQYKRYTRFYPQ